MNYIKNQNLASIFFLMFISQYGYADDISEQALPTVTVKQKRLTRSDNLLKGRKTSDRVIKGEQFRSRGSTIGEALNQELGIHANSFGAGASVADYSRSGRQTHSRVAQSRRNRRYVQYVARPRRNGRQHLGKTD
ncbi:hypothetical protein [Kingella kingae]|uniref:hypothetical protein n=1 Tax=Kingella kingae TaxID=504 RepID=UPI00041C4EDD|nr:hypothetical protein [Kingella kingae]